MNHGAVRKLMRTVASAFLVLGTATGVAALGVLAASPAIAQPSGSAFGDEGAGSNGAGGGSAPAPASPSNPVTDLVGNLTGGGRA